MAKAITSRLDSRGRRILDIGVLGAPSRSTGRAVLGPLDRIGRRVLDTTPGLIIPGRIAIASAPARIVVPEFPIISRGLPFASSQGGSFGGINNAEANAIDSDYSTSWDSVFSPNDGSPEWYALDLRSVPVGSKTNVWMIWKNRIGNYYEPTTTLGPFASSVFAGLPQNYQLQGHASSGSLPAVNDVGWTNLIAPVTNNRYNQRIHQGLNLSGYNWFRIYVTASSGVTGVNDSVMLQFDLRDASSHTEDSIFAYGDSITLMGFNARKPGNLQWANVGPFENRIQVITPRVAPVLINAGVGGWLSLDGDNNKATYIGGVPCKYVMLNFGTNDAHAPAADLNTLGGVNSTFAQQVKTNFQSMINYAQSLGKICIIPKMPWRSGDAFSTANVQILNQIIDQLYSENPSVITGPDFWPIFSAHTNMIQGDQIHPTYDDTDPTQKFNGLTGFETYLQMWADNIKTSLYTA